MIASCRFAQVWLVPHLDAGPVIGMGFRFRVAGETSFKGEDADLRC